MSILLKRMLSLWRKLFDVQAYGIRLERIRNEIVTGRRIASGPFCGIYYVNKNLSGRTQSALLGTYEMELWPFFEQLNELDFDVIVNAGAGEGYYAVGLAVVHPDSRVHAFEMNEKARAYLHENLEMNGVQNVAIRGICDAESLDQALDGSRSTLVVMDVEGTELDLLDPDKVPQLQYSHIIVELHDFVDPRISNCIRNRFEETHHVQQITGRDRSLEDFPLTLHFPFNLIPRRFDLDAIAEVRDGTTAAWFVMLPQNGAGHVQLGVSSADEDLKIGQQAR